MEASTQRQPEAQIHDSTPDSGLSLSAAVRSIYQEVHALIHDHLRLAALEARNAVRDLVVMIALAIVAALLVITGWLALVFAVVAWAVDSGASAPVALLIAAVVSVALAVAAAFGIRFLGSRVMFVLTLRWLGTDRADRGAAASAGKVGV
jgi:uncharacterized membrane protein YqjE